MYKYIQLMGYLQVHTIYEWKIGGWTFGENCSLEKGT